MIGKEYGEYKVICDNCGESGEPCYSFDEAREWARDNGWKTNKDGGEWVNLCPDCAKEVKK